MTAIVSWNIQCGKGCDGAQWPKGGHCRDYFAVTPGVAARIRSLEMDSQTDASDHQPLRLVIGD